MAEKVESIATRVREKSVEAVAAIGARGEEGGLSLVNIERADKGARTRPLNFALLDGE